MKQFLGTGLTVLIGMAAIVVALSVSYYYEIFLPHEEEKRINMETWKLLRAEQEANEKKESLNTCLLAAQQTYDDNWAYKCRSLVEAIEKYCRRQSISDEETCKATLKESRGVGNGSDDCPLPFEIIGHLKDWLYAAKDDCYKQYSPR